MAEDLGERTEEATPKRLREAREEGNLAKSNDASAAVMLFGATIVIAAGLMPLTDLCARLLRHALEPQNNLDADRADALTQATNPMIVMGAAAIAPVLGAALVIAYFAHVWQIGFVSSTKVLRPRGERMNPLAGVKRLFGVQGVMKTVLDLLKLAIVGAVAYSTIQPMVPRLLSLPGLEAAAAAMVAGGMLFELAVKVATALLILGLIDFAWQRWRHRRTLRMTKQQVKDEYKQMEGDPDVKRRRMQIQRQMAMQRINSAVPKSDVVVTNPEHISVAIRYDPETMPAPRVVAKGADHLALRIRQIARQHGIPIVERKPLARALYKQVKVGQEVPPDFYKAVAEVLAYVYRLDEATGRRKRPAPRQPVAAAG